jgi:hypothetical protein
VFAFTAEDLLFLQAQIAAALAASPFAEVRLVFEHGRLVAVLAAPSLRPPSADKRMVVKPSV